MDLKALETLVESGDPCAASTLDTALIEHHAERDAQAMLALHKLAAQYWHDDPAQIAFHRTHAYVYALEAGLWDDVDILFAQLNGDGRI